MSFRPKVLLILVLTGVLPVALLGAFSYRASRSQIAATVGHLQAQVAQDLARFTASTVFGGVESLRQAVSYLSLDRLPPGEAGAVLAIPFRQLRTVNLLALVNKEGGAVAPPVYSRLGAEVEGRPLMDDAALAVFSGKVPFRPAFEAGAAVGLPYRIPGAPSARVAAGVHVGGDRILVAELSLAELEQRLEEISAGGGLAFVVDREGQLIATSPSALALGDDERALVRDGLRGGVPLVRSIRRADGTEYLAAFSGVTGLGWGVAVGRRSSEALAASDQLGRSTLYWAVVALVLATGVGWVLARGVSRPVAQLSRAVTALSEGRYDQPVPELGRDEIGRLARTFNQLLGELRRRDAEIRAWGEKLQLRVDEQTRQLKDAQDQIARTRRLAALGSFSAGFTHELNNPLTSIIGLSSILGQELKGTSSEAPLAMILEQARRMARIVSELRQLADQSQEALDRKVDLVRPVYAALEAARPKLAERNIRLITEIPERLPPAQGDPEQIQRVVSHLLQNAISAMPRGGTLTVAVGTIGPGPESAWLLVRDTGKGIPAGLRERIFDPFFTTKDEPERVGLGLSVSHRIIEANRGRIVLESEEGRGATFTVILPAAGQAAHLY